MRDVIRATVVFDEVVDTREAVADFIANNDVVRVKDRFTKPVGGYRDLMLNYRTPEGLVVEVQFSSTNLLEAKFGEGHKMYEELRSLRAKEPTRELLARLDTLDAASEKLYGEAYERDGDGCGWQKNC